VAPYLADGLAIMNFAANSDKAAQYPADTVARPVGFHEDEFVMGRNKVLHNLSSDSAQLLHLLASDDFVLIDQRSGID
jgi:hypothetical protein